VTQFEIYAEGLANTPKALADTPKALANWSPGFEHRENPGNFPQEIRPTLKGFGSWRTLSAFLSYFNREPRVVATLQPLGWN